MYRDNTLVPSETVRLLALGILAEGDVTYGALAGEVRQFTGHIVGPSLELVGTPIQVLQVEGLVAETDEGRSGDDAPLRITEEGRRALMRLLGSNIRPPVTDINKLIVTLKMRFLHLLPRPEQRLQAEMIAEMYQRQRARLTSLRGHHAATPGHLADWLDHEIAQTERRLDWFRALEARLAESAGEP